ADDDDCSAADTVVAVGPQARSLIGAALARGTIDYPTSLIYRAYALIGDPRLPAELVGSGSVDDDPGLFEEMAAAAAALAPGALNPYAPFLSRPTDPNSVFFGANASSPASGGPGESLSMSAPSDTPEQKKGDYVSCNWG